MRVELTESESVAEPRLWVEHQQVLALVRPGPVEWGLRRSEMQRVWAKWGCAAVSAVHPSNSVADRSHHVN